MPTTPPPDATCPRCRGANLRLGKMVSQGERHGVAFRPEDMKFWTFSSGVSLEQEARACLDCGLIWTEASPRELAEFIAAKCKPAARPV